MRYVYEIVISPDDNMYSMEVPDLPGCYTWGDSIEDVLQKAPDALETHVGAYLADSEDVPPATFGHDAGKGQTLAVISFEATAASVGAPHIAARYAAERLGVSKGRVSQLLSEGRLEGYRDGRETMVSEASIERFIANRRGTGRPRKELTTA
jgi:excisionase family DNA binding protein